MSAPTPEAVARTLAETITGNAEAHPGVVAMILAALRAVRAAAIEEAARELEAFGDPAYYAEAIVAIRALGEESAAPREEATS